MGWRKQDKAPCVDGETSHLPGDATGQSQLAGGIEKEKHAFADAISLAARPQANPLRDCEILARSGAANRVVDVERDGYSFNCLPVVRGTPRDSHYGARKDCAGSASNRGKANGHRLVYR